MGRLDPEEFSEREIENCETDSYYEAHNGADQYQLHFETPTCGSADLENARERVAELYAPAANCQARIFRVNKTGRLAPEPLSSVLFASRRWLALESR